MVEWCRMMNDSNNKHFINQFASSLYFHSVHLPCIYPLYNAISCSPLSTSQIAKFMGPTWVLSAPDGPHEPCYQGTHSLLSSALPCFQLALHLSLSLSVFVTCYDTLIYLMMFPLLFNSLQLSPLLSVSPSPTLPSLSNSILPPRSFLPILSTSIPPQSPITHGSFHLKSSCYPII